MRDRLYFESADKRRKFVEEFIAANGDKIKKLPNYKAVHAAQHRLADVAAGKKASKRTDGAGDWMLMVQAKIDWMNLGYSEDEVYAIGVFMLSDPLT